MFVVIAIVYLVACALMGFLGRKRAIGFWGFFLFSFFLTPFPVLIVALITAPKDQRPDHPAEGESAAD